MRRSASAALTVFIAWFLTCSPSPAVTTERRCVHLASPQNTKLTRSAGNISGVDQHCIRTNCCMGYFRLESGKPTPMLLGCSITQTYCPNLSCHASTHYQNRIGCACGSDFCNTNITWNQQENQTESSVYLRHFRSPLNAYLLIIYAGALVLVFSLLIALKWKRLLECCRRKMANTHEILALSSTDLGNNLNMHKVVACGHFASVWQGTFQGSPVAVKVFPTALQHEFTKEKQVYKLPLMCHSGIVRFLGDGKLGKEFVLVLELATHGSLNVLLSRTVFDWAGTLKLAQTLSQGLTYLHTELKTNGVCKPAVAHCDLSSSNVMVRADGSCALCDFGCAAVLQCQALLGYSAIGEARIKKGTLQYMSPEILEGCVNLRSGCYLLQADVYSLGLILWELLMRCSDLCKDSPVPEHMLPYELELGRSPCLEALLTFVLEKRLRPNIPFFWARVSQGLLLRELLEDCWDHDADARLTAECAANRLASLTF